MLRENQRIVNVIVMLCFCAVNANSQKTLHDNYQRLFHNFTIYNDTVNDYWTKRYYIAFNDFGYWLSQNMSGISVTRKPDTVILQSQKERQNGSLFHWFSDIELKSEDAGVISFTGEFFSLDPGATLHPAIAYGDIFKECTLHGGSKRWQSFCVRAPYPRQYLGNRLTPTISLNTCFHKRGERIAIRNMNVKIDNMPLSEAQKTYKADNDHEFDSCSKFRFRNDTLSESEVQRLKTICLVWGYLKYHHPAIRQGEYDWNYELFRILNSSFYIDDDAHFQKVVYSSIPSYVSASRDISTSKDSIVWKIKKSWLNSDSLAPELYNALKRIDDLPDKGSLYCMGYTHADMRELGEKSVVPRNESTYNHIPVGDDGYRLLSLFRFWNMMYYFHPYMYQIEDMWINRLPEFIRLFANARDDDSYDAACAIVARALKDTHTVMYGMKTNVDARYIWGKEYLPMSTLLVDGDKLLVCRFNSSTMGTSGLELGDLITKVNGKLVGDIRKEKSKYSNFGKLSLDQYTDAYSSFTGDSVSYTVVRDNQNREILVSGAHGYWKDVKEYIPDTIRDMGDDICYINLSTVSCNQLVSLFPSISKKKGIIFDMRDYPQDAEIESIIANFILPHPTKLFNYAYADMNAPGVFLRNSYSHVVGKENPDYFKGKTVVLVSGLTMSMAEIIAQVIGSAPQGYIIGQPTGGVLARTVGFPFTSGRATRITAGGVYFNDGQCSFPGGVHLYKEIWPNPKDIKAGIDTQLKQAIEIIK